ncbi:MAG: hypothetical protein G01um101429_451 [Parcubacteria group bacterium Gr01-1014_29]|nr:MAG: hypothetical protein G01um101429_451 [Parcubacteria group bacterium Gr01-1014_29]
MKTKKYLILLLLGIFVSSLAFSFYYKIKLRVDAQAYNSIAWNLVQGNGYVEDKSNAFTPQKDEAILRVGPGYEFFLAGIYTFFGHRIWVVWIFHALLRVLTCFFLYKISLFLFSEVRLPTVGSPISATKISLVAVAVYVLIPDLLIVNGMVLAETLFLALLVGSLYVSLQALQTSRYADIAYASLWWGLAALVRPTVLPVVVLFAVPYIKSLDYKKVLLVFLFPVLLVGGWSVRNSLLYEKPLFTTTAGSFALLVGNSPGATGGYDKTPDVQSILRMHHSVDMGPIALNWVMRFMVTDPVGFLEVQIKKVSTYFSLVRPTGFWFYLINRPIEQAITLVYSALATTVLLLAGITGLFHFYARRDISLPYAKFFMGAAVLQPLVVVPLYVETRYRYPLYPLLAIFTAYAIVMFWHAKKFAYRNEDTKQLIKVVFTVTGIVVIFTLIDTAYSYNLIIDRMNEFFRVL